MRAPDSLSPLDRCAEQLETTLKDPVPMRDVARVMGVSVTTAYAMAHRFLAAKAHGDIAGMRDAVPCIRAGEGRIIVPRAVFIAFYVGAGLSRELLTALYGQQVAEQACSSEEAA
jgi:hypothetical protein